MRSLPCLMIASFICLGIAQPGQAQEAGLLGPAAEIGVALITGGAVTPRLTVHASSRTAFVFTADAAHIASGQPHRLRTYFAAGEGHRAVHQTGRLTLAVILGAGVAVNRGARSSSVSPVVPTLRLGAGMSHRLMRRLSVHEEVRFVLAGEATTLRLSVGLSVPLGAYRSGAEPRSATAPATPDAASPSPSGTTPPPPQSAPPVAIRMGARALETGQFVWITRGDGGVIAGDVQVLGTDGILVTSPAARWHISLDDIARLEIPDRVGDGARRGALIGVAGGAAFGLALGASCRGSDDCIPAGFAVGFGIFGAGFGVLIGALADSLAEHPVTLFDRSANGGLTLSVQPTAAGKALGARATLAW